MKRACLATLLFLALLAIPAHPQGCTQCRDNTAATPPKTQAAYRHAIILMTVTAGVLFLGTVAILKRQR
jgi:predicted small integral membrane protein